MRKRGKKTNRAMVALLLLAISAPGAVAMTAAVKNSKPFWQDFAREAAVASALYAVPERSLALLEERFNSESFNQEELAPNQTPEVATEQPPTKAPSIGESTPDNKTKAEGPPKKEGEEPKQAPKEIPLEFQGPILEENFSVTAGSKGYLSCPDIKGNMGKGLLKNSTKLDDSKVKSLIMSEESVKLKGKGPQVLIMHTHATESFEPFDTDTYDTRNGWRTIDNSKNVVAVGERVAEGIRAHGIEVIHDDTQHDYPSYNGSYERSAVTVEDYLEKYPSIKVVLDVHRDAVQREKTLVKPVTEINGKKTAQLMIIAGCDDGTMNMPNWKKNLRFAAGLQNSMETLSPGLTRPIFFCYRKYNQQLTTGSLLIEFGSHGNTLEEVLLAGDLAGDGIGAYLEGLK